MQAQTAYIFLLTNSLIWLTLSVCEKMAIHITYAKIEQWTFSFVLEYLYTK